MTEEPGRFYSQNAGEEAPGPAFSGPEPLGAEGPANGGGAPAPPFAAGPVFPPPGGVFYGVGAPPLAPYYAAYQKPPRPKKGLELALIALSTAILVLLAILLSVLAAAVFGLNQWLQPAAVGAAPPAGSFSVIRIQGSITSGGGDALGISEPSYHHKATLEYIRQLADDENDKGILLYMNTPGGGVYESDEIYRALEAYREKTGRPVWAYMAKTCASGGYYICMAAEKLLANYNTTTGSIGVYVSLTDVSGLYSKLGIETVLIRSGDNKGMGTPGVPVTEEQRAVLQSSVDESFARFVELIVKGRDMPRSEVLPLADGRTFTASQALEAGLIDGTGEWEATLDEFEETTGARPYYPNFSSQTYLGYLLSGVMESLPKSDTEAALDAAEALPQGVPMAYAYELAEG